MNAPHKDLAPEFLWEAYEELAEAWFFRAQRGPPDAKPASLARGLAAAEGGLSHCALATRPRLWVKLTTIKAIVLRELKRDAESRALMAQARGRFRRPSPGGLTTGS
ncbi:MAG: hypothetical protein JKY65_16405 [Planctomycetes bacterium]|nr:hypothetical protein [Planctomycetota bacterium]